MTDNFNHTSVLKAETIESILPSEQLLSSLQEIGKKELFFVDATLGGAGHGAYLIDLIREKKQFDDFSIHLIGFDRDQEAINHAEKILNGKKLQHQKFEFKIFNANFKDALSEISAHYSNQKMHGIYADFGVSSPQLDQSHRGFSFLQQGPVDMRMDQTQQLDAKDVLLKYSEKELTKIFFDYGEEPKARKLSQAIVMDRNKGTLPLDNIKELANYFKRVLSYPPNSKTHPATRAFQAIRIEVNNELESIETLLSDTPKLIHDFGKASFISFHSLEDRLVKHAMRQWQKGKMSHEKIETPNDSRLPLHIQLCLYDNKKEGFGKENPRGGIVPSLEELKGNSRSRSARLRCFEFKRAQKE